MGLVDLSLVPAHVTRRLRLRRADMPHWVDRPHWVDGWNWTAHDRRRYRQALHEFRRLDRSYRRSVRSDPSYRRSVLKVETRAACGRAQLRPD